MIKTCERCGGLYGTENGDMIAGNPCLCDGPLDYEPTRRARKVCAEWLYVCVKELGWKKEQLDELEACWLKYHDRNGHFKPIINVSATTPETKFKLGLVYKDEEGKSQLHIPSTATTPDMEKLAQELADKLGYAAGSVGHRDVLDALWKVQNNVAQVRESLVKDKERLDWLIATGYKGSEICGVRHFVWATKDDARTAIDTARSALTGTKETINDPSGSGGR